MGLDFTWNDVHDVVYPNLGKCMVDFWLHYICSRNLDNKKRKDRQQNRKFAKENFYLWILVNVPSVEN